MCANVSEAKINLLKYDDLNWFCTTCRGPAVQKAQTDKLIEDRCEHYMMKAFEGISKVNSELKGDIKSVNTKVSKLAEEVTDLKRLKDDITEAQDKQDELTSMKSCRDSGKLGSNTSEVEALKRQRLKMEADLERNKENISKEITQRNISRLTFKGTVRARLRITVKGMLRITVKGRVRINGKCIVRYR